ncbi:hypothetical protein [Clostridium manihotivorum]|uniref:hypothetical protein n=1 Tax=Clostridium manihotivorum TaxID=2320868 RepID=UPI0013E36DF8|nr:hypothetical protein [Clostridium manihotivorum]
MRVKLPGSMKTKIIILMILVFVSIAIFIKEGIENRKENNVNTKTNQQFIQVK